MPSTSVLQDKDQTKQLVDDIDELIATLNAERYSLMQNKKKILARWKKTRSYSTLDEAQRLFEETGVLFQGQIKKDFQQLNRFQQGDHRRAPWLPAGRTLEGRD